MKTPKNEQESEFYIQKRKLNALFDYETPLDTAIYRGQKPQDRGKPLLYPILKAFKLSNGRNRDPDIITYQKMERIGLIHPKVEFLCLTYLECR